MTGSVSSGKTILTDECALHLVEAIVQRAADDYRIGRRGMKRQDLSVEMENYYTWLVSDTAWFFRSPWFYMMGGSPAMWKQLKSECDHGYFKLRKGMEHSETHYCKY